MNFLSAPSSSFNTNAHDLWLDLRCAAQDSVKQAGVAAPLINSIVLDSSTFTQSLSRNLSHQRTDSLVITAQLEDLFLTVYNDAPDILTAAALDVQAVVRRDPAAGGVLTPYLYFKGFHAIQTHRVAHHLWHRRRFDEALFLQNRASILYGVDIHPAAQIGIGIMLDHATGLVIGETAVVEDNVSILHGVTLGGTGKEHGDRHPKVRAGVMIGAGAAILGNVEIGVGACIAAGSVVLQNVLPHTTVAGIPARIVGTPRSDTPADEMDQDVIPATTEAGIS